MGCACANASGDAAHHDRERSLLGAFDAAADGAVQEFHARRLQEAARRASRLGTDRRAIDDERAFAQSLRQARARLPVRRRRRRRR